MSDSNASASDLLTSLCLISHARHISNCQATYLDPFGLKKFGVGHVHMHVEARSWYVVTSSVTLYFVLIEGFLLNLELFIG